jgi:hypothetical protein
MVTFLRDNLEACIAAVAVIVSLFAWCRAGRANKIAQEVLDWQREGISSPSSNRHRKHCAIWHGAARKWLANP